MIQIPAKVQMLSQNKIPLYDVTNAIMSFVDNINPSVGKIAIETAAQDVESINIILTTRNATKLQSMKSQSIERKTYGTIRDKSLAENEFIKCELNINGDKYEAKIKFHALGYSNVAKNEYRIILKEDKLYENMKTFSLHRFERLNSQSFFMYDLYKKYLNVDVKHKIVRIKLNSVDQGFYFLEERLGKELLERNNMPGFDVFKFDNTWDHQYITNHNPPYVYDSSHLNYKRNSKLDIGQIYKADELLDFNNNANYKQLLDLNYMAMHEALRALYGDYHSIIGDNFKLMYSTSNGLFYPFLRTEHVLDKLVNNRLSANFEQSLHKGNLLNNNFLKDLIKDDYFRNLRDKNLMLLLDEKDELLKKYSLIDEKFLKYTSVDITNEQPTRFYDFTSKRLKDALVPVSYTHLTLPTNREV